MEEDAAAAVDRTLGLLEAASRYRLAQKALLVLCATGLPPSLAAVNPQLALGAAALLALLPLPLVGGVVRLVPPRRMAAAQPASARAPV